MRLYKPNLQPPDGAPIIVWARRLARYKRSYVIARFIEENSDSRVVYLLAGKPHPRDEDGLRYAATFHELHGGPINGVLERLRRENSIFSIPLIAVYAFSQRYPGEAMRFAAGKM